MYPRISDWEPEITLLIPARSAAHVIRDTVTEASRFLSSRFGNSFEILIITNSPVHRPEDPTFDEAKRLSERFPSVRVLRWDGAGGKGSALRQGFLASRGRYILITDADLPYGLEFFDAAFSKLREGYDLVSGNRRLASSHFRVPVRLLPFVHGRHLAGVAFNRLTRFLLPVVTTDTQAGIKAMSREFASRVFAVQACPSFFLDLEIFLVALRQSRRSIELPVILRLSSDLTTIRLFRDGSLAIYWLARIWFLDRLGRYS